MKGESGAGVKCASVCVSACAHACVRSFTLSVHGGQQGCDEGSRGQAQPQLHVWPLKAQRHLNRSEGETQDMFLQPRRPEDERPRTKKKKK